MKEWKKVWNGPLESVWFYLHSGAFRFFKSFSHRFILVSARAPAYKFHLSCGSSRWALRLSWSSCFHPPCPQSVNIYNVGNPPFLVHGHASPSTQHAEWQPCTVNSIGIVSAGRSSGTGFEAIPEVFTLRCLKLEQNLNYPASNVVLAPVATSSDSSKTTDAFSTMVPGPITAPDRVRFPWSLHTLRRFHLLHLLRQGSSHRRHHPLLPRPHLIRHTGSTPSGTYPNQLAPRVLAHCATVWKPLCPDQTTRREAWTSVSKYSTARHAAVRGTTSRRWF